LGQKLGGRVEGGVLAWTGAVSTRNKSYFKGYIFTNTIFGHLGFNLVSKHLDEDLHSVDVLLEVDGCMIAPLPLATSPVPGVSGPA
jgi:hypothetical protein